ncbi:MAG: symmetrical bis(5'-nucleosyl)-tetraphosphatase [Moraxellaceae bacterium]|nr:symmetrical bis(5'-nucleosyl)-tetraphosphatase [Moraxellaceae bacterium]
MSTGNQYIIGDLQGCYNAFNRLLEKIDFNEKKDKIYLAGDLVARGEDSLSTLRQVKKLQEKGCAETVLGNHDINLIAVWRGVAKVKKKDNTERIFQADDADELLNWLRQQPLLLMPNKNSVLTHAGIPPHWTTSQAQNYAQEVEQQLQAKLPKLNKLLPDLYRREADIWSEKLTVTARTRAITNYFTRMRLCDKHGNLEFNFKSSLDDEMPNGFRPWFAWKTTRKERIYFGHWAGLQAKIDTPKVRATDAGCVWGGRLLAYRLNDDKVFSVNG